MSRFTTSAYVSSHIVTTPYGTEDPQELNDTQQSSASNVADAEFNLQMRLAILWVLMILGTLGGFMVCIWLWYNRRRRSRVNMLILHVAVTDLCVMFGAILLQLVWEHLERNWVFGNVVCKLLKFMQSLVLIASNFMVVVLSIDRHQAIRAPLKEPIPVWRMTMAAWIASALLSLPMFFIFQTNFITEDTSQYYNMTVCESIFRESPDVRPIFLTFISIVHFCIPIAIISFCYIRIFLKIAEKANEGKNRKPTNKPGKVFLTSTASSSLPKAKVKTLKMTLVIVFSFIVCVLPYHIVEAIFNFGDSRWVSKMAYAILGAMACANSATNPYVFLLFNANMKCARGFMSSVFPCGRSRDSRAYADSNASTRSEYAINRSEYTMNTDITRTVSKYSPSSAAIETVEMTMKNQINNHGKKGTYTLLTSRQMGEQNSVRGAAM